MQITVLSWLTVGCLVFTSSFAAEDKDADSGEVDLSHGFNKNINWVTYEDSFGIAETENKPIFLMIHKTWCSACKSLKVIFKKAKELETLSKYFVMVNTEDDEEPESDNFRIDGNYIPRLYFLDPEGSVYKDIKNEKMEGKDNLYYYPNPSHIIRSMKKVLDRLGVKYEKKDEL